jgi:serine O-acetyltransferase
MKPKFRLPRMAVSAARLGPHLAILLLSRKREILIKDLRRWAELLHLPTPRGTWDNIVLFITFMTFTKEFRTVFYLRAGPTGKIFGFLCPCMANLDIAPADIGPGLFIQHGEGTFVSANRIGANCWIARQVMIGYSNETDLPTIGNNVRILTGAKIIGRVTIGDNATIGLNTVIMQDVPEGATMLGVPGKMIWKTTPATQPAEARKLRAIS